MPRGGERRTSGRGYDHDAAPQGIAAMIEPQVKNPTARATRDKRTLRCPVRRGRDSVSSDDVAAKEATLSSVRLETLVQAQRVANDMLSRIIGVAPVLDVLGIHLAVGPGELTRQIDEDYALAAAGRLPQRSPEAGRMTPAAICSTPRADRTHRYQPAVAEAEVPKM